MEKRIVPDSWCDGGYGCTCCQSACDCGCRDDCPKWKRKRALQIEADKRYVARVLTSQETPNDAPEAGV